MPQLQFYACVSWIDSGGSLVGLKRSGLLSQSFENAAPRKKQLGVRKLSVLNRKSVALFSQIRSSFHRKTISQNPQTMPLSGFRGKGLTQQGTHAVASPVQR